MEVGRWWWGGGDDCYEGDDIGLIGNVRMIYR